MPQKLWAISNTMVDLYHTIYDGEIFQSSHCITLENAVVDFIRSQLQCLGYQPSAHNPKVYQRQHQQVVLCLVDDFATCGQTFDQQLPYLFDKNTTVITDNWISVPTQYRVCRLPASFFGIYSHTPAVNQWQPSRRFNFSVNRIDFKRLLLLMEIRHRCKHLPDSEHLDLINFNCWSWNSDNQSPTALLSNFEQQWQNLEAHQQDLYRSAYEWLVHRMPWRNHDLTHQHQHVGAWVNVIAETYSSDTTVALSEKLFRAMCLPVPWTVYAGRHTVSYLHSLGFDVLSDVVDHWYDDLIETHGDKVTEFVYAGTAAVDKMKTLDFVWLQQRCQRAASHNQTVLSHMRQQWPCDFAHWWSNTVQSIS